MHKAVTPKKTRNQTASHDCGVENPMSFCNKIAIHPTTAEMSIAVGSIDRAETYLKCVRDAVRQDPDNWHSLGWLRIYESGYYSRKRSKALALQDLDRLVLDDLLPRIAAGKNQKLKAASHGDSYRVEAAVELSSTGLRRSQPLDSLPQEVAPTSPKKQNQAIAAIDDLFKFEFRNKPASDFEEIFARIHEYTSSVQNLAVQQLQAYLGELHTEFDDRTEAELFASRLNEILRGLGRRILCHCDEPALLRCQGVKGFKGTLVFEHSAGGRKWTCGGLAKQNCLFIIEAPVDRRRKFSGRQ